jgi:hypothetical protein
MADFSDTAEGKSMGKILEDFGGDNKLHWKIPAGLDLPFSVVRLHHNDLNLVTAPCRFLSLECYRDMGSTVKGIHCFILGAQLIDA